MNMEEARFNMIEQQIRPCDVLDSAVLQTMSDLPRDAFVSDAQKPLAYSDTQLPIAHGESMMHPRIEGRILQELAITNDDSCLEVGTGSGYLTACMANLSQDVYSIDIHEDFIITAAKRLSDHHISNVTLEHIDALTELDTNKRFDVIAVTGSLPEYLPRFEEMLKLDGRLYITVGTAPIQHAMLITRTDDGFVRSSLFETDLKALTGTVAKSSFVF
ncbi:MAG TPA: protein-L-isoaspartate O-methyltransferase [Leucothrix mucor]|nr:protein-L-isoaspartate O-methyltransferase [Leucothrix mucor]